MKLYVGNLPYTVTEDELRTLFAQAGEVSTVELIKDRDTGKPKGFGFVEMGNQSEGEKAIKMFNGFMLNNRELKVNIARPKEERSPNRYGGDRYSGSRDRNRSSNRPRRNDNKSSNRY